MMVEFDYDSRYRKGRLVCDEDMMAFVRNHFSESIAGVSFMKRKLREQGRSDKIPERNYAIQPNGRFDFGLWREIESFLIAEQIWVGYTDEFRKMIEPFRDTFEVWDGLDTKLRDYQVDCIRECITAGNGTVIVGTGGGKSLIQASILENWKLLNGSLNAIVVVPGLSLVGQLERDFADYGVTFSYSGWTGGTEPGKTDVIIVNSENLCAQFENHPFLRNVGLVLGDECHKAKKGNVLTGLIRKIATPHKFGFTGTLSKVKIDRWKVIGTFGPVIYEKKSKELRDENYLANVDVRMLQLIHPRVRKMGYKAERAFLENCEPRTDLVVSIAEKVGKNVLILVDRIEYGTMLAERFSERGTDVKIVSFVYGDVPVDERRDLVRTMEKNNNVVCIAMSSIFSTGINITNLHYIIFTFGGKSFIRTIQSVGRGLRLHETKQKLVLFDIFDNTKSSLEHAEERKQFYNDEEIPWKETRVIL